MRHLPVGLFLALAGPASALAAPATLEVQVQATPTDGVLVGVELKGNLSHDALLAKLDNVPYQRATAQHRLGEGLQLPLAAWQATTTDRLSPHIAELGPDRSLRVILRVRTLQILSSSAATVVRLVVDWELEDGFRIQVGRGVAEGVGRGSAGATTTTLDEAFTGAVTALLDSQAFSSGRQQVRDGGPARVVHEASQSLTPCANPASTLEQAIASTVVVRANDRVGTGSVVSPDGYVITAYHVVNGSRNITVRLDGGEALDATIVRVAPQVDGALLHFDATDAVCIAGHPKVPAVGQDLYVIGTPASEVLAFSVSKGIVSGLRQVDTLSLIQTDASINPGNSGGPLVDATGRWLGVVSFKIVGSATEGLGFGVPAQAVLDALNVAWAD